MSTSDSQSPRIKPHERIDPFLDGRLRIIQSRRGYRFSVDALHLAGFVRVGEEDRVADLGTGCGIIPLMLLTTRSVGQVVGLEIQEELASQAARNARLNGCSERMCVVRGDLRRPPFGARTFDVVVCNPPYRKAESGRINPDPERAIARHEILASLGGILSAARWLLRGKGRLATIYPAERLTDLLARMRGIGLEPKRVQTVHPNLASPAKLVLVEGVCDGRPGARVLPPIADQGDYTIPRA